MVQKARTASTEAVRAELSRILGSPHFDSSERDWGILRHVVGEGLAGRVKAYTIATGVFGRDPAFDPQLDAIVRIEADSFRRSFERYYLTDGRASRRGPLGRCARGPVRPRRGRAAAAELGLADEAADAVAAIRALDPDYRARIIDDPESRHPLIVAGLGKAGLPVPATSAS